MSFGTLYPAARKEHRCEYCYGLIPRGEIHPHYTGVWEREFQDWRMHQECYDDYMTNTAGEEFTTGGAEMPERVKALVVAV
jgi:hypothetical protein